MSDKRLIDLKDQDLLSSDIEELAGIFLSDFDKQCKEYKKSSVGLDGFITNYNCFGNWETKSVIYEIFQWLCNNGYIARVLSSNNIYFITRAGHEWLKQQ